MLPTLLACLLLWGLYLWLDRRRLLRLVNPPKPKQKFTPKLTPPRKTPTKPRYINSAPNPGAVRSQPSKLDINFDAVSQEATRRRQDLARVSPKTQNELCRLANGDAQMIDRLLTHTRSRNPDRPEQWIWEKVIRDLERDRGYR